MELQLLGIEKAIRESQLTKQNPRATFDGMALINWFLQNNHVTRRCVVAGAIRHERS